VHASSPPAVREEPEPSRGTGLSKLNSELKVGCRHDLGESDHGRNSASGKTREIHRRA